MVGSDILVWFILGISSMGMYNQWRLSKCINELWDALLKQNIEMQEFNLTVLHMLRELNRDINNENSDILL